MSSCGGVKNALCLVALRRYAMREALVVVGQEGLEHMWARHLAMHAQLWEGLADMGLEPFVEDPAERLVTVNTIKARLSVLIGLWTAHSRVRASCVPHVWLAVSLTATHKRAVIGLVLLFWRAGYC